MEATEVKTYRPIPREPHPDVAIVRHVFEAMKPAETIPVAIVASAIGVAPDNPILYRRAKTARDQLRKAGIVIVCSDKTFVRLNSDQVLDRHQGRERSGLCRKARKAGEALSAVTVTDLTPERRSEYFAERTINNVVYIATGAGSKTKMLAAAKAQSSVLPMALALEVLQNGKGV